MRDKHARQIAEIINDRNGLLTQLYTNDVLYSEGAWVVIRDAKDDVAACANVRTVTWYMGELSRVSTRRGLDGKGHGPEIVKRACAQARNMGLKVLILTTRADNFGAKCLFFRMGFRRVESFFNSDSGHPLELWSRAIVKSTCDESAY